MRLFRLALIIAILLAMRTVSWGEGTLSDGGPIHSGQVPLQIGEWKGRIIPFESKTQETLDTEDSTMRAYRNPAGEEVYLTFAYSDDDRGVSHPTELCYSGQGFEHVATERVRWNDEPLSLQTFQRRERRELVATWYRGGHQAFGSFTQQQLHAIWAKTIGRLPRVSVTRIATIIQDPIRARDRVREFSLQLEKHLIKESS